MSKLVVLSAAKSGCGRSTTCRALLVSAVQAGLSAVAIDCDPQQTISKWALRREKAVERYPDSFRRAPVETSPIQQATAAIKRHSKVDLILIDTPPDVENALAANLSLLRLADLIIVPTSTSSDDLDSVIPWIRSVSEQKGIAPQVLLNRVNRKTRAFEPARNRLAAVARVIPSEVPLYEDVQATHAQGLTVLDVKGAKGADAFLGVWLHVRREIGL